MLLMSLAVSRRSVRPAGRGKSETAVRPPARRRETPDPWRALVDVPRAIPEPLAEHPGNIYLEGEDVRVRLPEAMAG